MTRVVPPVAPGDQRRRRRTDGVSVRSPVHPRCTHAPLGAVVFVAVFDVVSAAAGSSRAWARDLYRSGTFVLTIVPLLVAVAIATGLIDRDRTTLTRSLLRARVNLHALVMVAMAAASAGHLALRRFVYPVVRHPTAAVLAFSVVALAAALVGGDLGGRLTYRASLGVQTRYPSVRWDGDDAQ
jgi:uncharacterized membrane protein